MQLQVTRVWEPGPWTPILQNYPCYRCAESQDVGRRVFTLPRGCVGLSVSHTNEDVNEQVLLLPQASDDSRACHGLFLGGKVHHNSDQRTLIAVNLQLWGVSHLHKPNLLPCAQLARQCFVCHQTLHFDVVFPGCHTLSWRALRPCAPRPRTLHGTPRCQNWLSPPADGMTPFLSFCSTTHLSGQHLYILLPTAPLRTAFTGSTQRTAKVVCTRTDCSPHCCEPDTVRPTTCTGATPHRSLTTTGKAPARTSSTKDFLYRIPRGIFCLWAHTAFALSDEKLLPWDDAFASESCQLLHLSMPSYGLRPAWQVQAMESPGLNFNLMDQLTFYGSYHSRPWNQGIHFVFVPLIHWTITVWLAYAPLPTTYDLPSHLDAALAGALPEWLSR